MNNWPNYVTQEALDFFITNALKEDVGNGDHSSLSTIPKNYVQKAKLLVKEDGIIAGLDLAKYIFDFHPTEFDIDFIKKDGDPMQVGDIAFYVTGGAQAILTVERLVLNCMQRMSGIATLTRAMQDAISHTKCKLLDTRKTTPNFRICEKWAVHIGGGTNHRYGLYDMIMLKDNHIDFAGGISKAVAAAKNYLVSHNLDLKIEVETRNMQEVKLALEAGCDRIMLDNFTPELVKEAVLFIDGRTKTEASGGITANTLVAYAEAGVDYISSGAITHSASNKDLSLKAVK